MFELEFEVEKMNVRKCEIENAIELVDELISSVESLPKSEERTTFIWSLIDGKSSLENELEDLSNELEELNMVLFEIHQQERELLEHEYYGSLL